MTCGNDLLHKRLLRTSRKRTDSVRTVVYLNFVCNRQCIYHGVMKTANNYRRATQGKLEKKFSFNKMRAEKTKLSICCRTETTSVFFFWKTDNQTKLYTISPDSWLMMFFLLQVRLLTGIARFHEMSYIFDTLFEHEHFELLCRRGIDKVTLFYLNKTVAVQTPKA